MVFFSVFIKILVKPALARVVISAELLGGAREALVRVVADGTVAHRRKEDGNFELELRREGVFQSPLFVPLDLRRALAQPELRLHRLAERVDGRVCNLRGVDEHLVPEDGIGFRVAHRGEQNAARICLAVHLVDGLPVPVCVLFIGIVRFYDLERVRRAQAHTAVAVDAQRAVRAHFARLLVEGVDEVGALPLADAAGDAAALVAHDFVFGAHVHLHQSHPPLS